MQKIIKKVENWGKEKGIIKEDNQFKQFAKFIEEAGELGSGLLKQDKELIKDSFGDVLVTLIILAKQTDYDLKECLKVAYNEIKDRKGKTVKGVFIKNKS